MLLATMLATGCAQEATLDPGALAPVRIGALIPLTGALQGDGPAIRDAILLAEQEVNAGGGVLPGQQVEVVVVDSQTNGDVGFEQAVRLISRERVVGILGGASSSVTLQVAEHTRVAGIPQISCCSTSPEITTVQPSLDNSDGQRFDRFLFRTVGSDVLQAKALTRAVLTAPLSCSRILLYTQSEPYGQGLGDEIQADLRSEGVMEVSRIPFDQDGNSYQREVTDGGAASPDCVVIAGFGRPAGTLIRDWDNFVGTAVTWIGTDGMRNEDLADQAGALADGVMGTAPYGLDDGDPRFRAFRSHYRTTFGSDPGTFSSFAYDAAMLMFLAIARAQDTAGESVRNALFSVSKVNISVGEPTFGPGDDVGQALRELWTGGEIDYDGASGGVDFDGSGDVVSNYEVWTYNAASRRFENSRVIPSRELMD